MRMRVRPPFPPARRLLASSGPRPGASGIIHLMIGWERSKYERIWLAFARAVTVGTAYVVTQFIPGSTSSFVAIFTSLLPFDIFVALVRPPLRPKDWEQFFTVLRPRIVSTAVTLGKGVSVGAGVGIAAI